MKFKKSARVLLIAVVILSAIPGSVFANSAPPVDMFQLPWEQGKAWVSYDGLDNGWKRPTTSPHNYKNGGAIDFAPRVKMTIGEDTSNDWVVAAAAGTVYQVGSCYIKIDHGNGWITEYWHLDKIQVTAGSKVSRNQRLGIIHNNATQQVCPGNEYPGPHLHFVFRPNVLDTRFAGWTVNYNVFTNKTTYTKNGQTVPILTPLMNIPDLQTVMRGILDWNTTYLGSVDPYRRERWSLLLVENAQFDIKVTPSAIGLVPVIVLLDQNGNEITRANGTLSSTQPAGFYYVEIRSDAGTGYYEMFATKSASNGATVTPTFTATTPPTATPTLSETVSPETGTPTPTGTLTVSETPSPTITVTPSPTGTFETNTPTVTVTTTPDLPATSIAGTQTAIFETQTAITGTAVAATQTAIAATQTAIAGTSIAETQTAIAGTQTAIGSTAIAGTQTAIGGTSIAETQTAIAGTSIAGTQTAIAGTSIAGTQTAIAGTFIPGTQTAIAGTSIAGTQTAIAGTSIAGTQTAIAGTSIAGTQTVIAGTSIAATQTAFAGTQTAIVGTLIAGTETANASTQTAIVGTSIAGTQTAIVSTSVAGTQTSIALTPSLTSTATTVPTPSGPYVLVDVIQPTLPFGQTSLVNVSLNNVPLDGYSAAEFTCTYNPAVLEVSGIQAAELFGTDPVSAINGPTNGQFILAIAGSNGRKATSSGTAFTFAVRGLQVGESTVQCTARVSTGQGALQSIGYIPDLVTVINGSVTPTATQPTTAYVTGQVLAGKPVTIQLYDVNNVLVVSQTANADGTFNIPMGGGTYTIIASAQGYLNAQGFINLANGTVTTMQTVTLPAGDIDGNSVIDQFDALTIGMNYNASIPAAADLNNDGTINVLDLELLAANYRKSGALAWQ